MVPLRLFGQQLYPNICSAELLDIDGDGLVELVVVMTDRVGGYSTCSGDLNSAKENANSCEITFSIFQTVFRLYSAIYFNLISIEFSVRTYRFVEELGRLVPLNKWEMPTHISGWTIGLNANSSRWD